MDGEKRGIYCAKHKREGMVNVSSTACAADYCTKLPGYNFKGMRRLYCSDHKLVGMVNVTSKSCAEPGCEVLPSYNHAGAKGGLYCATHRLGGMVNVTNKRCAEPGCSTHPSFNFRGEKTAIYCGLHKQDGMDNIVNLAKRCKSEWCDTVASNPRYKGYCLHCFIHLFPDQPTARNYKTKEQAVVDYITGEFPELDWTADKRVAGGCSRRRPDLRVSLPHQELVVEIDEDQHKGYDCSCENKRVMEISRDLGHRNIVFIRFNPDSYYDSDGKKVHSCWHVNKLGVCVVEDAKESEWRERLGVLKKQVKYWTCEENKSDRTIQTVNLFFDNH